MMQLCDMPPNRQSSRRFQPPLTSTLGEANTVRRMTTQKLAAARSTSCPQISEKASNPMPLPRASGRNHPAGAKRVDLLGHIGQERRDQETPHQGRHRQAARRHAQAVLLARMPAPLKLARHVYRPR